MTGVQTCALPIYEISIHPDTTKIDDNLELLADAEYDYILDEFSASGKAATGEIIFEDITDEELEYLEQNFDIGEIL